MAETPKDYFNLTVDGREGSAAPGATLLEAARQMGIAIPTLCHYRGMDPYGACRVCLVEIMGPKGSYLAASCKYPAAQGLEVRTETDKVIEARTRILQLLLARAPESQELREFAADLGVETTPFEQAAEGKCILCGLCTRVCRDFMGRSAISISGRSDQREVRPAFGEPTEDCQACGACAFVCPTGAIDLEKITRHRIFPHVTNHDQGLGPRPCIDLAHAQASPRVPVIDRDTCVLFKTGECGLCEKVCQADAIQYDEAEKKVELDVGAVVLTPGFEAFDAKRRGEFGFSHAKNVVTNVQFERLLSAAGPTGGHVLRPSDGKEPGKLAFIQCIGSRDAGCDNDYCSSVCCMAAIKEAILAKEHVPGLEVTVFFLDLRAFGKDFDRYYDRAKDRMGVRFVRSFISRTYEMPHTKNLRLIHVDDEMKQVEEEFDMVVLSAGLEPKASLKKLAKGIGLELNEWGFARTSELAPMDTNRPGIFVGGAFQEPKDIPDTVMQASAAAARAMSLLAPVRGTRVVKKAYPPERDITDEPPRVGIFVCHCGSNIASVVDVKGVVERVKELPHVVHAEHNVYTCADDSQDLIKERIAELNLNRVVIASCTPRTHEPIFRDTLRDAGLNPYLLEMANIRDQCSWVHASEPQKASEKACDLVRMTVGRTANLLPLQEARVPVNNAALVVGGGIAGMTAALAMAEQGFPVHLVEKEERLGGLVHSIHRNLDGHDVQAFLADTMARVVESPLITVHARAKVTKVEGHVGGFTSTCLSNGQSKEIKHGVVVVATGAREEKPKSFGYGESYKVITQLELSERLGTGKLDLPERDQVEVVMIQCVDQRNEERPFCSRVCCTTAVKNALHIKEQRPDARVMILYRDMRTYGFKEAAYREAREKGVLFVRYDEDRPPELSLDGLLSVTVREPALNREMKIHPEMVVLAAPMVPGADREDLSELLRVPLNGDGFFLEAHMKLRPVDFASEGLFLCGTAHAPKFMSETLSQAHAVAARAASILSRKEMPVSGQIAWVDPDKCVSCMTCVHVCPYMAPTVGEDSKAEVQGAVCMGCGSCASECPARAITLRNYVDTQILGAVNSLLGKTGVSEIRTGLDQGKEGIVQMHWHKEDDNG